jgi:hypothetical protein
MSTAAPDAPPAPYPLHRRVLDLFVAPGTLFHHFREHTPWAGPLLIAMALGMAAVLLVPQEVFVEQARESVRQAGGTGGQMPDPETLAGFARLGGAVAVLIVTPLAALIAAGVLTLVFSTLGGGEAHFRQYMAVTTHCMLITALGGLVTLPIQIARADLTARLSLALLAPVLDPGSFAFRFLQGLEIFTLWALVVAALGVSVLNRRVSWGGASAIVLGIYLLVVAGVAAIPR